MAMTAERKGKMKRKKSKGGKKKGPFKFFHLKHFH
jgi:hypothetical protein